MKSIMARFQKRPPRVVCSNCTCVGRAGQMCPECGVLLVAADEGGVGETAYCGDEGPALPMNPAAAGGDGGGAASTVIMPQDFLYSGGRRLEMAEAAAPTGGGGGGGGNGEDGVPPLMQGVLYGAGRDKQKLTKGYFVLEENSLTLYTVSKPYKWLWWIRTADMTDVADTQPGIEFHANAMYLPQGRAEGGRLFNLRGPNRESEIMWLQMLWLVCDARRLAEDRALRRAETLEKKVHQMTTRQENLETKLMSCEDVLAKLRSDLAAEHREKEYLMSRVFPPPPPPVVVTRVVNYTPPLPPPVLAPIVLPTSKQPPPPPLSLQTSSSSSHGWIC